MSPHEAVIDRKGAVKSTMVSVKHANRGDRVVLNPEAILEWRYSPNPLGYAPQHLYPDTRYLVLGFFPGAFPSYKILVNGGKNGNPREETYIPDSAVSEIHLRGEEARQ